MQQLLHAHFLHIMSIFFLITFCLITNCKQLNYCKSVSSSLYESIRPALRTFLLELCIFCCCNKDGVIRKPKFVKMRRCLAQTAIANVRREGTFFQQGVNVK